MSRDEQRSILDALWDARRQQDALRERLQTQMQLTLIAVHELGQAHGAKDIALFMRRWLSEHQRKDSEGIPIKRENLC